MTDGNFTNYPICGAVWAVIYAKHTGDRGKRLADFLTCATHEGQELVVENQYARLPKRLIQRVDAILKKIQ